jgi:glutamyl-tRNA synthetase
VKAPTLAETSPGRESRALVVGRLAPSPTGLLHLGHAFAFCVAWWSARSQGGRVVLRFDDLDVDRAQPEHIDNAMRDLRWLGLDWDGEPVLESSREGELKARADFLEDKGLAYACVCSRSEIGAEQRGAPQGGIDEVRYSGRCRGKYRDRADARQKTGREPVLRFLVDDGDVAFIDRVFGSQIVNVAATVGDFPIVRKNGAPAYQLAVVLDDELDRVTEVVRGRDLLPSTARQLLLGRCFGLSAPSTLHVPLVVDENGRRLAKRDQARSLAELRERGVDARQIVAWAAEAAGQELSVSHATADEVRAHFDSTRIGTTDRLAPSRFGPPLG